jgi:lysine 2,3-aminomutase
MSVARKSNASMNMYQRMPTMSLSAITRTPKPLRVPPTPSRRALSTLSTQVDGEVYWRGTPWRDVPAEEFNSYRWQVSQASAFRDQPIDQLTDQLQLRNTVTDKHKLQRFLVDALPETLGPSKNHLLQNIRHKQAFIEDAVAATKLAPMAIRLTPHVLSRVDWNNPLDDPIRRQFIPLASGIIPDDEQLKLDSLHEEEDSRMF